MPTTRKVKETFAKSKANNGPKPIWDLYDDGLTQGAISTFLDCRHQFWLKYVMGYRNKAKAGATFFGSAFHDILAAIQFSKTGKPKTLERAASDYLKSLGTLSPSVLEETNCMLAQIKMLIELYNQRWEAEHAEREWLKREETFRFVYEFVKPGSEQVIDIPLRGRWDGVFQTKKAKELRLHETKTKGRIDEEGIAKSLPFDTQTMLYSLAIQRQIKKGTPKGTCYDVIRNPQLKLKQGETTTQFVDRCAKDVQDRPDWYFLRFNVSITEAELTHWENHFLAPVLWQIVQWWESIKARPIEPWKSPLHFMRPGAFWSVYGRSDMFEALTSGNTFSLERREIPFPELVD